MKTNRSASTLARLVLTGTPTVGKTTLGRELAKLLRAEYVSVNEYAEKHKLLQRVGSEKEKTAKLRPLARSLSAYLKKRKRFVAEGHLACEFNLPCDKLVVLRARPSLLVDRMRHRGYTEKKIAENAWAELLDYCLVRSLENYPKAKVVQLDVTRNKTPAHLLKRLQSGESDLVRWLPSLPSEKSLRFLRQNGFA